MLTLIAESKTMSPLEETVKDPRFPAGEQGADMICARLAEYSVGQIADMLKVSPTLATACLRMAREFPFKATGYNASQAYTGVVFRALDIKTFTPEMWRYADGNLLIVSSLYSLLRPTDTIKPYRLDYTSKAAPEGLPMWRWQQEATTQRLIDRIKADGTTELLNLMPGDACKCFDWRCIQSLVNVIKVDFKELTPGGGAKTPNSNRLKQLRGQLCRYIVERQISDARQLEEVGCEAFVFEPDKSTASTYTFLA